MPVNYYLITAIYENGDKYTTRRDTKKLMRNVVDKILNNKEIVKFTVETRE